MIDKLYYTIAEVAEALEVPQPTLRFWEKEFTALKPRRTSKGLRQYTKEDVDLLKKVVYLTKDCGYTLEGAKKVLKQKETSTLEAEVELAQTLNEIRSFLTDIKQTLKTKPQE